MIRRVTRGAIEVRRGLEAWPQLALSGEEVTESADGTTQVLPVAQLVGRRK